MSGGLFYVLMKFAFHKKMKYLNEMNKYQEVTYTMDLLKLCICPC